MFLAHLPAGYLSTALVPQARRSRAVMACALTGSVLPDLDLLYFYLPEALGGDGQATHHHAYLSHTPLVWAVMAGVVIGTLLLLDVRRPLLPAAVFFGNALMHHVLDTPMGGVRWQWPLSDTLHRLIDVPARYEPWVLSFVLHPSFLMEIAVVVLAGWVWRRRRARARRSAADHRGSSRTPRSDPSAAVWHLPDRSAEAPRPASGPTLL